MKKRKLSLLHSIIALLLCASMLVGTTFAWFTDGVTSGKNRIVAGNLDVELEYMDAKGNWHPVEEDTNVFAENTLWEPGHTEVVYLRVSNKGSLALKYQLGVNIAAEAGSVNMDGKNFVLSDYIEFAAVKDQKTLFADRAAARLAAKDPKILSTGYTQDGTIEKGAEAHYVAFVVYMPEEVGNDANYRTGEQPPRIDLGISLLATQATAESDSFGSDYDYAAGFPQVDLPDGGKTDVTVDNGTTAGAVTISGNAVSADVPAGVAVNDGTTALELSVTEMSATGSNITLAENEVLKPLDVHVEGVSATNSTPIAIKLTEFAPKGLNMGNLKLYHVEKGKTNVMTYVAVPTPAHNEFTYDPATGDVTLYLATFSEVAMVADTENAWNGSVATAFAGGAGTKDDPYIIANADQLAYMGDRVSNDNTNCGSAYYKLISDINIGGVENYNTIGRKVLWYPIGYNKVGGTTTDKGNWYTYGGAFTGTFDGTGHTITGIYQNTWAMVGDYSGTYYNDAMGLFGYVNGGTVKNLTIDSFYSEGEFAPTGCVAAYAAGKATFENIAITNSHPQTYNTGVAGIVGWDNGGDTEDEASSFTFKNITVDDTNTISALWGSWDVAAAGLLGYLGEYSKANFENCNVAATIDVYNDVCGNYQYYWYRYCGAFIGTVDKRLDNGKGALDLSNVTATNCTVNFGDRHEYYYCEFEKNTQASYTVDYQFSRVPHSELNMDANPVTCKHTHTVNEDKQAVYIPFRQLFGGYGWGVDGVDLGEYNNIEISDVTNAQEKFETNFTGNFLYRVGNQNTVSLGSLFAAKDGVTINNSGVYVTIDKVDENANVGGTFTANTTDWTKGTIQFSGTGVVKLTIQDYNFCTPTELTVEVVDATNLTSATGTTSGGTFVLLSDVNTSDYVYYWNSTLYGNGFTYSLKGAPTNYSSSHGHGVLITKNATLDNLRIIGDVYNSYGAYTNQNYYNAAVDVLGDTTIQNCYISGCAAPVSTRANATITNTTLYGGTVANLIIKSGTVALKDVTTANFDDGRSLVGMGIVIHSDATESAKLVQNGELTQYNFLSESKVPTDTYAKNLHTAMFDDSCSKYHFGTSPNRYVNAGIISLTALFNAEDITDNANTGYVGTEVSLSGVNGYVYTQPNTSGSVNNDYDYNTDTNVGSAQGAVPPSYSFDYTTKNYVAKTDGSNDYCYEENGVVNISMDDGDTFNWDTAILTVTKGNQTLDYTVSMNGDDYTGKSIAFDTAGDYEVEYTYTDPNNQKLDENGNITTYSETYTKTVHISVAVIEASAKSAEFTMGSSNATTEKITIDNTTYISATGVTADNSTWTYITINGQKIYYPIVAAKLTSTKGSSTYAYFPVFENVVTITDYADNGTGDAFAYNSSTTTLPSALTAVKGIYKAASDVPYWYNLTNSNLTQSGASAIFKWASSSSAPSDPTTYNNVLCYKSPQISANRDEYITLVQYSYTDATNTTYYYYVGYTLGAFTKQTTCVTPDTLVTLADGTQKRIDQVTYADKLLVWDFYEGRYNTANASIVMNHGYGKYEVVKLNFADGTTVKTINGHGFYTAADNKFVILRADNAASYVGQEFIKQDGSGYTTTKLVSYSVYEENTESWSVLTAGHYNCILEGMFTLTPAEVEGSPEYLMPYAIDSNLKYNKAAMNADVQKYGLYTYADFADYMTYQQFQALGLANFKVSVAKGYITWDEIMYLISIHITK